jgi:uncharacterized membrane protein YGL010W
MRVLALTEILASYGSYHRDRRNRLTHFCGVPAIIYALLLAASLKVFVVLGVAVGLDRMLIAVFALGYLALDLRLGLALAAVLVLLGWGAEATSGALGAPQSATLAASVFVLGWVVQFFGHHLEGNRPALLTNLAQMLVAPLYLTAELGFALHLRPGLEREIEGRLAATAAASAGGTSSLPARQSRAAPGRARSDS